MKSFYSKISNIPFIIVSYKEAIIKAAIATTKSDVEEEYAKREDKSLRKSRQEDTVRRGRRG